MLIAYVPLSTEVGVIYFSVNRVRDFLTFVLTTLSKYPYRNAPIMAPVAGNPKCDEVAMSFEIQLVDYGKGFELAHDAKGRPDPMKAAVVLADPYGGMSFQTSTGIAVDAFCGNFRDRLLKVLPAALTQWTQANPWFMEFIEKVQAHETAIQEETARNAREREIGLAHA